MPDINLAYPINFEIDELTLITASSNQKIDLMPYLLELNLYEDIFSPSISAQIVISEAVALSTNFRLNGTEFVSISFSKFKGDPNGIKRVLRVYKISGKKLDPTLNYESYVLNLCSEELLLSEQYRISRSFSGKEISTIVNSLLKEYLNVTKNVDIENTIGVYDFILPNKKIFETISWLSNYAQTKSDNSGADMLFFENSRGYKFKSLQTLFEQPSYIKYFYNPKNIDTNMESKIKNVLKFEVINYFDVLGGIAKGTFSNRVIAIDPLTRTYSNADFDYMNYRDKNASSTLNEFAVLPIYKDRFGKEINQPPEQTRKGLEAGNLRMVASNSLQKKKVPVPDAVANDIFIETFLPNRVAQLSLANYIKIRIQVPGNNELLAGMTIDFSVPTTFGESRENDPLLSGKYIITAVRHMIKVGSPTAYVTILELAKDSVSGNLPPVPTNSYWSDVIKGNQNV